MLNDFPGSMFPIFEGTRFIHVNSSGRGGHSMIAEALVHVYLGWHNLPLSEKTTSLAHELGHLFSRGKWETEAWLHLSAWSSVRDETFFLYRYNGKHLKRLHPDKYQYMRDNVFHGAEFDSSSCM